MMNWTTSRFASVIVMVGCTSTGTSSPEPVESNTLGVTSIEIEHNAAGTDPMLEVRGLDAADHEVARLELRTGKVRYTADPGLTPEVEAIGTELVVRYGDVESRSVTPDLLPHELVGFDYAPVKSFLHLRAVAAALVAEGGITVVDRAAPSAELPYNPGWDREFPQNKGTAYQACADDYLNTTHAVAPSAPGVAIATRYASPYGAACRASGGQTGCTSNCSYGPCGYYAAGTTSQAGMYPYVSEYFDGYDWWCSASFVSNSGAGFEPNVSGACTCTGCNSDGTPSPAGCHNIYQ